MLLRRLFIFFFILISSPVLYSQEKANVADSLKSVLSEKYLNKIDSKIAALNKGIESKTIKMLKHLQKQEGKLNKLLSKKDSIAAQQLFAVKDHYKVLSEQIKNPLSKSRLQEYIPEFDSLKTSLSFLNQTGSLSGKLPKEWVEKLKTVNTNVLGFESRLQQANDIKQIIKERRRQLKEQLEKLGLSKQLKKMNKEVYYYQQQLSEYKSMLKDRKKIEQKAIAELRKLPAFTAFMKKNSQLASMFRLPDNYGTPESLTGLQTRASVQSQLQQRFGASAFSPPSGGAGGGYLQQQMQAATAELNKIKDKLNKLGGGSSDMEMSDFKPNSQKTKSFLKRIEYGANVQSQKTNSFLPISKIFKIT